MIFECVEKQQLLLRLQAEHLSEQFGRRGGTYETGYVHVDECGHQELTVETIHDAAMAGYHVSEVLRANERTND